MASNEATGEQSAVQVELGRATVRDFIVMLKAPNGDTIAFFEFCDKVVVGGILDMSMDELPDVMGEVAMEIGRSGESISKAIALAQMLGDIDKHLEGGDDDD